MQVKELISKLQQLPKDCEVGIVFDGSYRADVEYVWLARRKIVLLGYAPMDTLFNSEDQPLSPASL